MNRSITINKDWAIFLSKKDYMDVVVHLTCRITDIDHPWVNGNSMQCTGCASAPPKNIFQKAKLLGAKTV